MTFAKVVNLREKSERLRNITEDKHDSSKRSTDRWGAIKREKQRQAKTPLFKIRISDFEV